MVPGVSAGSSPGLLVQHRHKLLLVRLDLRHQVWVALAEAGGGKVVILTGRNVREAGGQGEMAELLVTGNELYAIVCAPD